jgi:hypothetical protein
VAFELAVLRRVTYDLKMATKITLFTAIKASVAAQSR